MSTTISTLDPLGFPLAGSHLIEASAGTGKTFTIAMLYVRLILGHGTASFTERALIPPDILVVTFTDAATKELRDRIRARLTEAAACFREEVAAQPSLLHDNLLHALRAQYPASSWPACARKLELAAEWMDEAAVSTIHGWCQRMLREHAFDSQSLFTQHLETDQSELRADVVRDYWRKFYYPLSAQDIAAIHQCWSQPQALEKAVRNLLDHVDLLPATDEPDVILQTCSAERERILAELKAPWPAWADELQTLFDDARDNKHIHGTKLNQKNYTNWLTLLREWATSDEATLHLTDAAFRRLTPEGIAEAWKTGTPPTDHPAILEMAQLPKALRALPEPGVALLTHAARWIAREFDDVQKRRAQMGFDDLLTGLEAALQGPHGEQLANNIRKQFPVALIDEFQDTDPVQYQIFERIYQIAANRQDCAIILIGDPKQAIYAFRGADIHTYLRAREAVGNRLYTLDRNFRSTAAMVQAANHCFAHVENNPASEGAFLFRKGQDNPVPFLPVRANGRDDVFTVEGRAIAAMTLAVYDEHEEKYPKGAYIERMSAACASQVVAWLNLGEQGQAGFMGTSGLRAVSPADMAILVNNGMEAASIRAALARRRVRSVYLSDKDSVYASPQAMEIYRWLSACAAPDNDRLLRAALATPSLGLTLASLDTLNTDEEAWEERVVQFKGYRDTWQRQGVLPMLRRILLDFGCQDRLLHMAGVTHQGERILTDILHLAELLQQASFTLEGEHALVRFLSDKIAEPGGDVDNQKLRLESDANLVKVITIHKSKGLEYPLVFLPFISATRLTKPDDTPLKWHDDQGNLHIDLVPSNTIVYRADRDRLGEDVRKLYVALTRARYHTWLGLSPIDNNEPSAIGHLFGLASGIKGAHYLTAVRDFTQGLPCFDITADLNSQETSYTGRQQEEASGQARRPVRKAREDWYISSYSALRIEGTLPASTGIAEDTPQTDNLTEALREVTPPLPYTQRAVDPMHRFPKGAEPGTFLHTVMEFVVENGFNKTLKEPHTLHEKLARLCEARGWQVWESALADWVRKMITTDLPMGHTSLQLQALTTVRPEMEFWFAAHHVDLAALDQAIITHTLGQRPRPALTHDMLNGMLRGFMDLVFEHEGQYFVADYKSNWLGPTDAHYTAEAMEEAIRAHRYDLQYAIYLFALHRLLRARLPDYDYDKHMGGAVYLFVRGIGAATAGVHFERPPRILIELMDKMFSGETAGAQ